MDKYSKSATVFPKKYFYDTVLIKGDGSADTIWHAITSQSFVNQFNDTIHITDLKGKVLIINTFFTHCPGICAALSKSMFKLQESIVWNDKRSKLKRLSAPVHLISISIDPERDDPNALKRYAEQYKANHDVWWFLTGEKKPIYDYVINELKLGVVDGENVDSNFIHSDKLILIDRNLTIRGYYSGLDSNAVSQLASDAGLLILEK